MFDELDVVALTHNIEEYGLSIGTLGTIVQSFDSGKIFEVEFVNNEGKTTAIITLRPQDVRLVWSIKTHHDLNVTTSKSSAKNFDWGSIISVSRFIPSKPFPNYIYSYK